MPKEKIITALDIGTTNIRLVVAKIREGNSRPQVIGVVSASSQGMIKGAVVDMEDMVKSVKQVKELAEKKTGLEINHAFVNIGGSHITCRVSKGVVAVSRADGEISEEDKNRAVEAAKAISISPNREIIHTLPRRFKVDETDDIKNPVGMNGVRLEVDALLIEGATPHIKNLIKCVREAKIEEDGLLLSPLAVSKAALTKRQKELGVLSLDLGGGTTGLTVFEESDILHCYVLPVGGTHITNDIAIGLRIPIETAEKIKLEYGSALARSVGKREMIDLTKLGESEGEAARQQVAEIIEDRVNEIFDLVNKELKKINRVGFLPAGVVITGGGAKLRGLVDLAKEKLKLPAQIGFPQDLEGIVDQVDDPSFATAVGLIFSALSDEQIIKSGSHFDLPIISDTVEQLKKWFKGFLP